MKFALDTNIFFAFEKNINLGRNPHEVVQAMRVASARGISFYVTPSVVDELHTMFAPAEKGILHTFLTFATIQSPNVAATSVPSGFLYEYITDLRRRNVLGIKIAEELIEATAVQFSNAPQTNRIELQKGLRDIKSSYRERFKNATRTGIVDSAADLDIILLALELQIPLVTADDGLLLWARKLGVQEIGLPQFGELVRG